MALDVIVRPRHDGPREEGNLTLVTIAQASNTLHSRQNSRSACESGQDVGTMTTLEAANGQSRMMVIESSVNGESRITGVTN